MKSALSHEDNGPVTELRTNVGQGILTVLEYSAI